MGKPSDPPPAPPVTHKVAREVKNPIAPPPVRILLEAPVEPQDSFDLHIKKAAKPSSGAVTFGPIWTRVKIEKANVTIEFEHVRDDATYEFGHSRNGGGGPENELIDGHVPGSLLNHPTWKTPGMPSLVPPEHPPSKIQPPRRTPPSPKDQLLKEDVTDFAKVHVEEVKIAG